EILERGVSEEAIVEESAEDRLKLDEACDHQGLSGRSFFGLADERGCGRADALYRPYAARYFLYVDPWMQQLHALLLMLSERHLERDTVTAAQSLWNAWRSPLRPAWVRRPRRCRSRGGRSASVIEGCPALRILRLGVTRRRARGGWSRACSIPR